MTLEEIHNIMATLEFESEYEAYLDELERGWDNGEKETETLLSKNCCGAN